MRKVVQLESFIGRGIENLFALCDDGAVFAYSHEGEWYKLPPIPQEKDEDPRMPSDHNHRPKFDFETNHKMQGGG